MDKLIVPNPAVEAMRKERDEARAQRDGLIAFLESTLNAAKKLRAADKVDTVSVPIEGSVS